MTEQLQRTEAAHLLRSLFRVLEEQEIRYCVLHSYEDLPEASRGDLDLAVDERDAGKLPRVLRALERLGYQTIQELPYAVGANYYVLAWPEGSALKLAALDVIWEHRRCGLILGTGREMVAGRRRRGEYWVADPAVEFRYLLAKKVLKRRMPLRQQTRLQDLAWELGRVRAEAITREIFGRRRGSRVAEACASGCVSVLLVGLRRRLLWTVATRRPWNLVRYWGGETARWWRRWRRPTGLFVAVLGPDGAGKTTLVDGLIEQLGGAFRRVRRFHWRPGLIWPPQTSRGAGAPHEQSRHGRWTSVVRLIACLVDYWLGYWILVRPFLARTGLVIFDRYFDDLLADPKRYRYGGPASLVRALCRVRPRPDVALVLEAPAELIFSRKQEVSREEIERQRPIYHQLAGDLLPGRLIEAARPQEEMVAEAARVVAGVLAERLPGHGVLAHALDRYLGQSTSGSAVRSFAILPSDAAPRWLLPLDNRRATLEGLGIYTPYRSWARLAKGALATCLRSGWTGWARDVLVAPAGEQSPLDALVEVVTGERRPVFSFSVGAGRFAKLTVQVSSTERGILGYIKLPLTAEAEVRVRHEARTLEQLGRSAALQPHLPHLLYAAPWQQSYVLFQGARDGRPGPSKFGALHEEFLERLGAVGRCEKAGHEVAGRVSERWTRWADHLEAPWRRLGERAMEQAWREVDGEPVWCGTVHGDFAPWNTRVAGGHLYVFDWESAGEGEPLAWDRFHFDVQAAGLSRWGWRRFRRTALFLLYLVDSTARLAEEGCPPQDRDLKIRRRLLSVLLETGAPGVGEFACRPGLHDAGSGL